MGSGLVGRVIALVGWPNGNAPLTHHRSVCVASSTRSSAGRRCCGHHSGLRLLRSSRHARCGMKVVVLCGGLGTRLREETEFRPKPMVELGSRPILWHIMKTYAHHGFREFVLCLGYRGNVIKEYFLNYEAMNND